MKLKITTVCLAATLLVGMTSMAFAAETPQLFAAPVPPSVTSTKDVTTAGGTGEASLELTVTNAGGVGGDIFSATVPAVIPLSISTSGEITVPTNARIVNNNYDNGILVSGITLAGKNDWKTDDFDTGDFSVQDSKLIAMSFNGDASDASGNVALTANSWKIAADGTKDLTLAAKLPVQSKSGSVGQIATVSFTLAWDGTPTK